jgi:hypothetical protein
LTFNKIDGGWINFALLQWNAILLKTVIGKVCVDIKWIEVVQEGANWREFVNMGKELPVS